MDWETGPRGKGEVTFLAHIPPRLYRKSHHRFLFKQHFPFSPHSRLQAGVSAAPGRKAELLSTPRLAVTSATGSPPAQFP